MQRHTALFVLVYSLQSLLGVRTALLAVHTVCFPSLVKDADNKMVVFVIAAVVINGCCSAPGLHIQNLNF